jgi:hypothetical protein
MSKGHSSGWSVLRHLGSQPHAPVHIGTDLYRAKEGVSLREQVKKEMSHDVPRTACFGTVLSTCG